MQQFIVRYGYYSAESLCWKHRVWAEDENAAIEKTRAECLLRPEQPVKVRKAPIRKKLEFVQNDGGRAGSSMGVEKLDCTVRALAIALQMDYTDAHNLLAAYGRKDRHRFGFRDWANYSAGKYLLDVQFTNGCRTLGQFITANPKGTFLCLIRGHVLTLIDGIIHDTGNNGAKSKLYGVWTPRTYE